MGVKEGVELWELRREWNCGREGGSGAVGGKEEVELWELRREWNCGRVLTGEIEVCERGRRGEKRRRKRRMMRE